jgi:hypothetical protein
MSAGIIPGASSAAGISDIVLVSKSYTFTVFTARPRELVAGEPLKHYTKKVARSEAE